MTNPARHVLTVHRDGDSEFGPDAAITCPGVTETCAEWIGCSRPKCRANADRHDTLSDFVAHGERHRYFDEGSSGYWAVRSGSCYAENHGDATAAEFAEEQRLGAGRYTVTVEVDDSTIILTSPEKVST